MRTIQWAIACIVLTAASVGNAQQIIQSRGADQSVDYGSLATFGPWDDRNYELTAGDLKLLAANESELHDPIPAFFRVKLRREFPHLQKTGPVQYPRAAVPLFYKRYGGLKIDGIIQYPNGYGEERAAVPVNTEVQLNSVFGANEITVEVNPADPNLVIAGSNNNGGQEMYYSTNGGATWTIQGTLPNTCCDPSVDWSSDGTIAYVAALSGSIGVSVWRSFNGGQSWVDREILTNSGSDKEWIHVDKSPTSPYQDNVYVSYHNGNVMQFARSTNNADTFTISAFGGAPRGIGSDITTTSNGDIYHFYGAFNERDIVLLKSTNGGNSFTEIKVADTQASFDWPIPAFETRRAWIYVSADADRSGGQFDGSVYAAWTDTTAPDSNQASNNHTQIHVARSRDGGNTWQESIPHATGDVLTVDRFNQWLTVDQDGVVHVVFYDTRNDLPNRSDVDLYYTQSTDGGVTWGELTRMSSQTSANLSDGQEWGDYNGISVVGDKIVTSWTDNRTGPPNRKTVYAAEATNTGGGGGGDNIGGTATEVDLALAACRNNVTLQTTIIPNPPGPNYDCTAQGLAASPGDTVLTFIRGNADCGGGACSVSEVVTGISGNFAVCRNQTTGQALNVPLGGGTSVDCAGAGLNATQGDLVTILVNGTAD